MPELDELNQVLKSAQNVERMLFKHVAGSFLISLVAVAAQYDKFPIAFQAIAEIIGGLAGVAGILAAYLGNYRHPEVEDSSVLDFRPKLWGLWAAIALLSAAGFFYLFYYYASNSEKVCILFLAVGNLIFFYTWISAVIGLERAQKQRRVWDQMTVDQRVEWIKRKFEYQQQLEGFTEELRRLGEEVSESHAKITGDVKKMRRDQKRFFRHERLKKIAAFLAFPWRLTKPFRKRFGWLTLDEHLADLHIDEEIKRLKREIHQKHILEIQKGRITSQTIQESGRRIFPIGVRNYFLIETDMQSGAAKQSIDELEPLRKEGRFKAVIGVVIQPADVSVQARQLFDAVGIELVDFSPTSLVASGPTEVNGPTPGPPLA